MSLINVVSVELPKYEEALPQWKDALSDASDGCRPRSRTRNSTHCVPVGVRPFSGRIECAALGDIILAKLMATANHFQRSLLTETPTLPVPVLLFIQLSGSNRFDQHGRSSTLHPGDWCLIDTLYPFDSWSLGAGVEVLVLTLGRPADADLLGLLEQGVARRWDGRTGMSRVLQCTVLETFEQMNRLALSSRTNLDRAITDMVWAALREQIETPAGLDISSDNALGSSAISRRSSTMQNYPSIPSPMHAACQCGASIAHLPPTLRARSAIIYGCAALAIARRHCETPGRRGGPSPRSASHGASRVLRISVGFSRSGSACLRANIDRPRSGLPGLLACCVQPVLSEARVRGSTSVVLDHARLNASHALWFA